MHTEERPGGTARRSLSAKQGERPQVKPSLPTSGLELLASRTTEKYISVVQVVWSVVFCYGIPGRLIQSLTNLPGGLAL